MKLGVLTVPLYDRPVEEAFKFLSQRGVQAVELGTGGSPGKKHTDPERMLTDDQYVEDYKALLEKYNLEISAFSCHSNHVHPQKEIRELAHKEFIDTCKIAEKFGVDTVVTFSGCPGDSETATYPNWVTCSWPKDYSKVLEWQWNEVLIPYWKKAAAEAAEYGVTKIALELHPGFCVYNTETLLRLRKAVGPAIGANFDPSHLYWQGIEPVESIRELKGAIYHFHAKDTQINKRNTAINGVLDTGSLAGLENRSWLFRCVGIGHDAVHWQQMMSALRLAGYDGAVSIEHEDAFMSIEEGLETSINFLKDIIIKDSSADIWWA